jgi:gliding motility-associated-like protein
VASFRIRDSVACSFPFTTGFIDSSKSVQPLRYFWSFGDGATSTLSDPTHTYQTPGVFTVRLEVENEFGCKDDTIRIGSIKVESFDAAIQLSDTFGCVPTEISYGVLSNVPVVSSQWFFGNGESSTAQSGTVIYSQTGNYNVLLNVISGNGCIASDEKIVQIGSPPLVNFTATPTEVCRPPLTVQFTNLSQGASGYRWEFGDGTTSVLENPSKTYNRRDSFFVRLTATSPEGCSSTLFIRNFIIINEPVITILADPQGGCLPFTTNFSIQKTGPGTITDIFWDFGNGNTFQGINPPRQTYFTAGTFTVTATISFSDGNCQQRTIITRFSAGNPPSAFSGTISSSEICANSIVKLSATGGAGANFTWDMGNGEIITGRSTEYNYRIPGNYTIKLTATNSGCPVTITVGQIKVNPPATSFIISTLCGGLTVNFRNTSEDATTSIWDFGDGGSKETNNNSNVSHTYATYGLYNVRLIAFNSGSGCSDTISRVIDLREDRPQLKLNSQMGCSPLKVNFRDTSGNFRGFRWELPDTTLSGNNRSIFLTEPGAYSVTVYTLDEQGCRDTFRFKDIIKVVKPEAGFQFNPLGGCAPITVNFNDTSKSVFTTINSWIWDFGGLGNSTQKNPSFTFSLTDTVPITLIVTDNLGCKDTATSEIPVSFPKAQFSADFNSICTKTRFPIQNQSFGVALQYFWNFGNGTVSTEPDPQPIYNQEGEYTVSLLVIDDNQCRDSLSITNFVKVENFVYDFSADNMFKTCPELITLFSISPSDILYNQTIWDFGNGNTSTDTSRFPVNIYTEAGTYNVALILEDFRGCRDTIVKPAFIRVEGPSGKFIVEPDSGCVPLDVVIQAEIKNSRVNFWDFGDGRSLLDTSNLTTIELTYKNPGRTATSLVLDDGQGCVVLVNGPTVFVSYVDAEILPSTFVSCNQEEVIFTDISLTRRFSPIVNRVWNLGDGTTALDDSIITHQFEILNTRPFTVKLTATNSFGCFDTDSAIISVYTEPPLETDGDKVICLGDEVQLNASGVAFYEWFPAVNISQTDIPNPIVKPIRDVKYIVKGYDVPNCADIDTVFIKVVDRITGFAGTDTTICLGEEVILQASPDNINSGNFSFEWTPAINIESPFSAITKAKPSSDQMYLVKISNGSCTPLEWPVYISVAFPPELTVNEARTIFAGQEITLSAFSPTASVYQWSPPQSLNCADCPFTKAKPSISTDYQVKVTDLNGCSDSATIRINVIETCNGELLALPNVFSPNNDGLNDEFAVKGMGLRGLRAMKIFSRTGEMVFENYDINKGWDGKYNGVALNSGVYVYYIEFDCENGSTSIAQGNITLLR